MKLRCVLLGHKHRDDYGRPVGPCVRCGKVRWNAVVGNVGMNYIPQKRGGWQPRASGSPPTVPPPKPRMQGSAQ